MQGVSRFFDDTSAEAGAPYRLQFLRYDGLVLREVFPELRNLLANDCAQTDQKCESKCDGEQNRRNPPDSKAGQCIRHRRQNETQ